MASVRIGALLGTKRVIVCCGAGGVGKTTTAAALSLAAARAGRRVLVLTIDPSRRLAETLGVSRNPPDPVRIPKERSDAAGITTGTLDAWMLDIKLVSDSAVRRLVKSEADAQRILSNRIYQQVSTMVAGMHEYTAMEALHRLVHAGQYDLVVLDTPPSRNALDFLEAPRRLSGLVDTRAISAFLPKSDSLVARTASRVIEKILSAVFGEEFAHEFVGFLTTFTGIFQSLNVDVGEMRRFLSGDDVAFLLVTSPAPAALTEASFFHDKTRELALPFRGFVLNRSHVTDAGRAMPSLPEGASPAVQAGLPKLLALAQLERAAAERDRTLLGELERRAGQSATALALPELPQGADDIGTLVSVADALAAH
ncbi:MAG: ArsA family ATPase [Myxococcaceae bacterium]|jgi:anion-transporting  ArsA/GET3 family ATPase|nr:ArsA family ATPase [Myxococcaceae bacterium]MCA3011256.1 ArsA family ATPase [Myxococcaceae bacterium]